MFNILRHSLIWKLILTVVPTMAAGILMLAYFVVVNQQEKVMRDVVQQADRLSNTIKLGAHYAMMINSREDIRHIIQNVSRQKEIENIRIFNKAGKITFTNHEIEAGQVTNIKAEACYVCHRTAPPLASLPLEERTRIFASDRGYRLLGILSPIYNEPGCSTGCHVHPEGKEVLGALDMVISLEQADRELAHYIRRTAGLAGLILLLTLIAVFFFVIFFVRRPMSRLIEGTKAFAQGDYSEVLIDQDDEMGQLAAAFNKMGSEIGEQQAELNRQRDEFQNLFESVPCTITVQDRNFRLLMFNKEFEDKFSPELGDYCYHAYKGRDEKCENCPVEKTFDAGLSVSGEQSGIGRDGESRHWIVRTSPIRGADGQIVAAMEMNLDITARKMLEIELEKSEKRYHAIFNNIPNPVFVLDADDLEILDINDSVSQVYGYDREELIGKSFADLYEHTEGGHPAPEMPRQNFLNPVKQKRKDGRTIFVNIRVSPAVFESQRGVLLVTTSDVTKRLEVEEQLNQAAKLTTLGEMATGVAHELNQPLSVIKTVSSFFIKKIKNGQEIGPELLHPMLEKVDSNVDRATRIITHMRLFARKSDVKLVPVRINDVIERAFDIFNQQLKVRGIEVIRNMDYRLPKIMADPGRLEQVFINLLINARDAIEEKYSAGETAKGDKRIDIVTRLVDGRVQVLIRDSGAGIPKDCLGKVFDPFFTTKEVGKGTGLGLSISYGIVKDCGGDIKAASNGQGAQFTVEFPVRDENYEPSHIVD